MSYRCQGCRKQVTGRAAPNRRVVETREKTYGYRKVFDQSIPIKGKEIAKELLLCPVCAEGVDQGLPVVLVKVH